MIDDGRPVVLLSKPAGGEADDPRGEGGVADDQDRVELLAPRQLLVDSGQDLRGQRPALQVLAVDLPCQRRRLFGGARGEQLERGAGVVDASRGVDTRPQREGDDLGIDVAAVDAGDVEEGLNPRPRGAV